MKWAPQSAIDIYICAYISLAQYSAIILSFSVLYFYFYKESKYEFNHHDKMPLQFLHFQICMYLQTKAVGEKHPVFSFFSPSHSYFCAQIISLQNAKQFTLVIGCYFTHYCSLQLMFMSQNNDSTRIQSFFYFLNQRYKTKCNCFLCFQNISRINIYLMKANSKNVHSPSFTGKCDEVFGSDQHTNTLQIL